MLKSIKFVACFQLGAFVKTGIVRQLLIIFKTQNYENKVTIPSHQMEEAVTGNNDIWYYFKYFTGTGTDQFSVYL